MIQLILSIIRAIIGDQRPVKAPKGDQRSLKMGLPLGLYKLINYDRWDDQWNGDGDYHQYDIYKLYFYQDILLDRPIVSPAGLYHKIITDMGLDPDQYTYQAEPGDDSIRITSGFWRWYATSGCHTPAAWDIAREEGLAGWDYYWE